MRSMQRYASCLLYTSYRFLVNNDEIALHYMMSTLTRLGIRYDSSTDGKEIIRILKEAYERGEGYDICFVNWQMPGGYGKKPVSYTHLDVYKRQAYGRTI